MVITDDAAAPPAFPEAGLDDLRRRLAAYRRVALPKGHGWDRGTDPDFLAELVGSWRDAYDWREHEARLRNLPLPGVRAAVVADVGEQQQPQVGELDGAARRRATVLAHPVAQGS